MCICVVALAAAVIVDICESWLTHPDPLPSSFGRRPLSTTKVALAKSGWNLDRASAAVLMALQVTIVLVKTSHLPVVSHHALSLQRVFRWDKVLRRGFALKIVFISGRRHRVPDVSSFGACFHSLLGHSCSKQDHCFACANHHQYVIERIYAPPPVSQTVLGRMAVTVPAIRRAPHGVSRLVLCGPI